MSKKNTIGSKKTRKKGYKAMKIVDKYLMYVRSYRAKKNDPALMLTHPEFVTITNYERRRI